MWLVFVKQCSECGGNVTAKLFSKEPTENEVNAVEVDAGNSICQTLDVLELKTEEMQ